MNEQNLKTIALKLAEVILLYKGEISIEELKALPFIDENDAQILAQYLQRKFNLKIYTQELQNEETEDILSLL